MPPNTEYARDVGKSNQIFNIVSVFTLIYK